MHVAYLVHQNNYVNLLNELTNDEQLVILREKRRQKNLMNVHMNGKNAVRSPYQYFWGCQAQRAGRVGQPYCPFSLVVADALLLAVAAAQPHHL